LLPEISPWGWNKQSFERQAIKSERERESEEAQIRRRGRRGKKIYFSNKKASGCVQQHDSGYIENNIIDEGNTS